jgi:hypothetical protein
MTSENRQWEEIKAGYLKQIEKNLAKVDHPQRSEILANVRDHLDSKYAELSADQRTWESFQQIITEMGPPEEYAELLMENNTAAPNITSQLNTLLAIAFIIVLAAVGSYLVHDAKKGTSQSTVQNPFKFELDERVPGKWITVDFVRDPASFQPGNKLWTGDFSLKELTFYNDGTTSGPWAWSKNLLWHPGDRTKANYEIQNIQGESYLFMEWISGDVTIRGQKPRYYVLKKAGSL